MSDYPEKNCPAHPERLWEWDGYGYVCVDCIMDKPRESERTITLPADKVRHAVDLIVASLDFGSGFFDQEDVDFLRDLAARLGDVCLQAVTPSDMRIKYPPCAGTQAWFKRAMEERLAYYAEREWLKDSTPDYVIAQNLARHAGHDEHPM